MNTENDKKLLYDILDELLYYKTDVYGGENVSSFAGLYDDIYEPEFYVKVDPKSVNQKEEMLVIKEI